MEAPGGYVSRGGQKLAAALRAFTLDVRGWVCADLGASTGGFTDCLLQAGAARVFAVDTAYGQLAYTLRRDPRVVVLERSNALYLDPWTDPRAGVAGAFTGCDFVSIDLGWTPQRLAVPAALRWLRRGPAAGGAGQRSRAAGCIVSLIKPQYEAGPRAGGPRRGVLGDAAGEAVLRRVLEQMPGLGVGVAGCVPSPIRGSSGKGPGGNLEHLALLRPTQ